MIAGLHLILELLGVLAIAALIRAGYDAMR